MIGIMKDMFKKSKIKLCVDLVGLFLLLVPLNQHLQLKINLKIKYQIYRNKNLWIVHLNMEILVARVD